MHLTYAIMSLHSSQFTWQHSLQPHSAREPLPPLCALLVLICTKVWCHSEESNMSNKCKHTKVDDLETNAWQYPLLDLLSHIQEKTGTHAWLHQAINHLFAYSKKHALFISKTHSPTNVPKHGNHMPSLRKNVLNRILWFWMKFKCGTYSNS